MNNFKRRVMDSATELYVDLGLPSGLLWATCNVGATSPEQSGLYFAWGDPNGYSYNGHSFSYANYNSSGANSISTDISISSGRDMARLNMGTPWRLPTSDEWEELNQNCTRTYVTSPVYGVRFTSNISGYTDKSIFLPLSGYALNSTRSDYNNTGYYWSSIWCNSNYAYCAMMNRYNMNSAYSSIYRYYGLPIRAVIGGGLNALSEITLNATGNDSKNISVTSIDVDGDNAPFTASIDVNWATVSVNGTTITVTANSDNNTPNIKSGTITLTLTDTGKTFNITVKLKAGDFRFQCSEHLYVSRESRSKRIYVRCSINGIDLDWNIVETNLPSGVNVTKIPYDGYPGGDLQWSWDSTDSDKDGWIMLSTSNDISTDRYMLEFHQAGNISAVSVNGGVLINDVEHNIKYILSNIVNRTYWCGLNYKDIDLSVIDFTYSQTLHYFIRSYESYESEYDLYDDVGQNFLNVYLSGGTGIANTAIIANECPNDTTTNNAAKWCMSQTLDGKQGYLPSMYELYMYGRVGTTVSDLLLLNNQTQVDGSGYNYSSFESYTTTLWSSTEASDYKSSCDVWCMNWYNGRPEIGEWDKRRGSYGERYYARCAFPAD